MAVSYHSGSCFSSRTEKGPLRKQKKLHQSLSFFGSLFCDRMSQHNAAGINASNRLPLPIENGTISAIEFVVQREEDAPMSGAMAGGIAGSGSVRRSMKAKHFDFLLYQDRPAHEGRARRRALPQWARDAKEIIAANE